MKYLLFPLLLSILSLNSIQSQEKMDFNQCVQQVLANNLDIVTSGYNIESAIIQKRLANAQKLPSLNMSSSFAYQFGKNIDPTSNTFINDKVGTNSLRINSGFNIFSGGRLNMQSQKMDLNLKASRLQHEQVQKNIILNLAFSYLNILQLKEQITSAEQQSALTKKQYANTQTMIKVGRLAANDILDLEVKLATEEQNIAQLEAQMDNALLQLKQLMGMDYDKDIQIKKPEFGDELQEEKDFDLNSIYNQAIHNYPQLQVADLNEKTALLDVRLERSSYYPSLSGFVSLDSRFSTKVMQINGEPIISLSSGQPVSINGVDAQIAFYQPSFSLKKTPYFDQIKDNFGQAVGVSLSVPIFNNLRTKSNVELAKLGRKKAEIAKKEIENQLRADLSKTINDLNASKKQFFATQKTKIAAKNAYNNAEKKYDLGSISSLELLSAKNNLEKASSNFIMAKYNYLFNKKILDYYTKGVIQF